MPGTHFVGYRQREIEPGGKAGGGLRGWQWEMDALYQQRAASVASLPFQHHQQEDVG